MDPNKVSLVGLTGFANESLIDENDVNKLEQMLMTDTDTNTVNNVNAMFDDIDKQYKELERGIASMDVEDDALLSKINSGPKAPTPSTTAAPRDPYLEHKTAEHKHHTEIEHLINDYGGNNSSINFEKEFEDDERNDLLTRIQSLRSLLLENEEEDISGIPEVGLNSSLHELRQVHMLIRRRVDFYQSNDIAQNMIMGAAYLAEYVFDGKKTYFGRQPDLTGWSHTVGLKLRRLRHETSEVVDSILKTYNLGPKTRILMELIPSMIVYSQTMSRNATASHISSDKYSAAITNIRNQTK